jgi:hypothetical protein
MSQRRLAGSAQLRWLKSGAFDRLRGESHFSWTLRSKSSSAERSIAFGDRVTFLLRGQEKSNQKRRPPRLRALRASLPARSAVGLRGLSTGHPALTPNWFASMRTTLRAFPPPVRRFRGAPGRAAGHRGPHCSEEPDQKQNNSRAAPFRPDRSPVEKPGSDSRTCRAGARQAPSGVPLSLVTFSRASERKGLALRRRTKAP